MRPTGAAVDADGSDDGRVEVRFAASHRRVAAGQSVVLYQGDEVVGGGIVARADHRCDAFHGLKSSETLAYRNSRGAAVPINGTPPSRI